MNTGQVQQRPLTWSERRQLKQYVRYRAGGLDDFLVNWLIVGGLVTLIAVFSASQVSFTSAYLVQITIACALLTAIPTFFWACKRRRRSSPIRVQIEKDLKVGLAEVHTFEVSEAVAVEEFEDEGTGFYLKIGPRHSLFVVGQYLDDLSAERKFPSTLIQFVRSPTARIPLGLTPVGTYLRPAGIRPPFTKEEFKKELVPSEGDLLEIDFDSLKNGVRKYD